MQSSGLLRCRSSSYGSVNLSDGLSLEVINRLTAVEQEIGALYAAFAQRFADRPELRLLWSELAEDEQVHAGLLGEIREGLIQGTIPPVRLRLEMGSIEKALDDLHRQRERVERGPVSLAEALSATIALETSEINDTLTRVVESARPFFSLSFDEGMVKHLHRLLLAVDQLNHPELTAVLKELVDRADRRVAPQLTILIVDDEEDMRETCIRVFRRTGYRCLAVSDGQEALALLDAQRPDLILTDLRMPRVDGLALLRKVRRLASPPPVVIFTAYVSEGSIREALEAGAAAYLPKPFTPQKLREVVEPLLRPV